MKGAYIIVSCMLFDYYYGKIYFEAGVQSFQAEEVHACQSAVYAVEKREIIYSSHANDLGMEITISSEG